MCVILEIEPNVIIPTDKLDCACDINKHGFGIAYVDNNEIKIIRDVSTPNDPKVVADHLQKLKKFKRFVHLRHATVGAVNLANCHPFVVIQDKKKPRIAMMHNGTLQSYTPPADDKITSDTAMFNAHLVRPLALRLDAYLKTKYVIDDFIFKKLVDSECNYSVVVIFDAWGNVVKFNEQRGKQFDGWWASNDYSFSSNHQRSSTRTRPQVVQFQNYRRDNTPRRYRGTEMPWEEVGIDTQMAAVQAWDKETTPEQVTASLVVKNGATKAWPSSENEIQLGMQMREAGKFLKSFVINEADK